MKYNKLIFVSIFFFYLGALSVVADVPATQGINIPREVDLLQYTTIIRDDPGLGSFVGPGIVRIWGWSRTGKVAYSVEGVGEYTGFMAIRFVIFDFVNDKVLIYINTDADDIDNYDAGSEDLFVYSKDAIANAIKTHNIVEQNAGFLPFPINWNNKAYRVSVSNTVSGEDMWGRIPIKKYTVSVAVNGKSKVVMSAKDTRASRVYICGYFLSPFENRALIILAEQTPPGFEGDVNVNYVFIGCHLEQGF